MALLQTLISLGASISLAALIVAIGLDAGPDDLLYLFRRPARLAKAFLAVNVVVPAAAAILVFLFPLSPIARAGVLLMAVSPMPPLVPGKGLQAGSEKCYVYGLYAALVVLAIVVVPLAVAIMSRIYGVDVSMPASLVARNVIMSALLPLAVGLALRRFAPRLSERLAAPLRAVAMVLLLVVIAPILVVVWPAMMALIGNGTFLAMALIAAIALAAGHVLGGPDPHDRTALGMAAATRHPGMALLIARTNNADKGVTAAIVAMLLVGLIVSSLYQFWVKRREAVPTAARPV
jgi:BASS family bile acid:Na+ symporter